LYLETPDATRYVDYLYAPFQEFNTEHINHFSARALDNAARHFGFRPVLVEQKVIQTAADTLYPAVFGIFREGGGSSDDRLILCDRELPSKIAAYIERSAAQMEQINRHLAGALADTQRVIVWGAGQLAMKLLSLPALARTEVRAVLDNNPVLRGKRLGGAPIVSPQDIAETSEPIIIATLLHADEISAQIRRLGLKNPVLSLLPQSSNEARSEVSRS